MSSILQRVGGWTASHAKRVLAGWLLLMIALGGIVAATGMNLATTYKVTGTESMEGLAVMAKRLPQATGASEQVLFSTGGDIEGQRTAIESFIGKARKIEGVSTVTDPFAQQTRTVSRDGHHALVLVQTDSSVGEAAGEPGPKAKAVSKELTQLASATQKTSPDLTVQRGANIGNSTSIGMSATELLGLVIAAIVLIVTLGSVVAAGAPLLTAATGVAIGMLGMLVAADFIDINSSTPVLAVMIGLAVGIDYALFIISRAREYLAEGVKPKEAAARANATAGSAVLFAGGTVIVALCGLAVARIPFLTVMGLSAAAMVAVAVLVAVTAVPAMLGLLGERLTPAKKKTRKSRARGWVHFVTRVPALTFLGVVAIIGFLAVPLDQVRLALPTNGNEPVGTVQRDTYDAISRAYGQGYNSPIVVVADIKKSGNPLVQVMEAAGAVGKLDGVDKVSLATPSPDGSFAFIQIIPKKGQADPATTKLVKEIRDAAPGLEKRFGLENVMVTGHTAVAIDIAAKLSSAILPFGIVVIGLSVVLLLIVFRSVAIPIIASLGYLLSLAAGMGAVGAVFGWGWAADLLNVSKVGAVISFLPVIVMGVLFGLAMDYQVFLVSRMRLRELGEGRHGRGRHHDRRLRRLHPPRHPGRQTDRTRSDRRRGRRRLPRAHDAHPRRHGHAGPQSLVDSTVAGPDPPQHRRRRRDQPRCAGPRKPGRATARRRRFRVRSGRRVRRGRPGRGRLVPNRPVRPEDGREPHEAVGLVGAGEQAAIDGLVGQKAR